MGLLREIRLKLLAGQGQMAEHCGVTRQHWSKLERGEALPTAASARRLTGLGTVASSEHLLTGRRLRLWTKTAPYLLPWVNEEPWRRAQQDWAYPLRRLGLDPLLVEWMVKMMASESALESYGWFQLGGMSARPQISNPHQCGFRDLPVMHSDGKALGERLLAGLFGEFQGLRYILWPQVYLRPGRTTLRPDGLVWLRKGTKGAWCILEFDGPTHDEETDTFREGLLRLPAIRVSEEDVKGLRAVQVFLRRAERILNLRGVITG